MAIKTLKAGIRRDVKAYRGICHTCQGEYEWAEGDAKPQADGDDGTTTEIDCPNCGKAVMGFPAGYFPAPARPTR